jgi:hypothetical protein
VVRSSQIVEYEGSMEFVLAPSASPSQQELQVWDLHGPIRAETAALWWPQGTDSIAAVWLRDTGVLWNLALDPAPEIIRGTAIQVLPKPDRDEVYEVRATQTACREGGALPS